MRARAVVLGAVLVALVATGCADDTKPRPFGANRPSGLTADGVTPRPLVTSGPSASSSASAAPTDLQARYTRWGLQPFAAAPKPPATKPVKADPAAPPVIKQVPTDQKIVFVTIDDGAEKDPKFVEMLRDLDVPVTMFLNDMYIEQDPEYFRQIQQLGNSVQNHTMTHPNLNTLSADAQKREICGDSDRIEGKYGKRPYLFRPPFGNYNEATLKAAGSCGLGALVLWRESMQINDMQYADGTKQLQPGDVILAHFRGPSELKGKTMTEMMVNLFRKIQEQGFTIARLDDYVG